MCIVCLQSYRMEDHEVRPPHVLPLPRPPLQKSLKKRVPFQTPSKKPLQVELAMETDSKTVAVTKTVSSKNPKAVKEKETRKN